MQQKYMEIDLTAKLWTPTLVDPVLDQSFCRALPLVCFIGAKQLAGQVQRHGTHYSPMAPATSLKNSCCCCDALQSRTEGRFNVISRRPAILF